MSGRSEVCGAEKSWQYYLKTYFISGIWHLFSVHISLYVFFSCSVFNKCNFLPFRVRLVHLNLQKYRFYENKAKDDASRIYTENEWSSVSIITATMHANLQWV